MSCFRYTIDHELTFICKYIHVRLVHLNSRGTVRAIQKEAKLLKRIHIPWRLLSFFGPCYVCHVSVIKVLVRFTSIGRSMLDWLLHGHGWISRADLVLHCVA